MVQTEKLIMQYPELQVVLEEQHKILQEQQIILHCFLMMVLCLHFLQARKSVLKMTQNLVHLVMVS